jgi:hypothetical protein
VPKADVDSVGKVLKLVITMKFPRRQFLHLAAGAAALPVPLRFASAQVYPSRPVRWIVAYPAGGGTDIFARLMAQSLSGQFGQPFIIENRSGAASNIATETVVRAPADGYTLLESDAAAAINPTLYENLNFKFHPRRCRHWHHPHTPPHVGASIGGRAFSAGALPSPRLQNRE